MIDHIRIIHEGKKEYKCDICNKFVTHKGDLTKHIKTLFEENPWFMVQG